MKKAGITTAVQGLVLDKVFYEVKKRSFKTENENWIFWIWQYGTGYGKGTVENGMLSQHKIFMPVHGTGKLRANRQSLFG